MNLTSSGELTLEELTEYMDKLTFSTISRNPEAPIVFAPLTVEERSTLLIDADEVARRRATMGVKGHIKGWCMWTIASPLYPRPLRAHVTGRALDRSDLPYWWTTSQLVAIASDLSCVFTASGSLYDISNEKPDLANDGFVHIVTVLNTWGWRDLLKLPHFFY